MQWYDFILLGLGFAVLGGVCYGYLEGFRSGFLKGPGGGTETGGRTMNEELEQIARDMRKKERELWAGNPPRMGNGAVALMLDGYASRLEVALGLAPRPKGKAAERKREEGRNV